MQFNIAYCHRKTASIVLRLEIKNGGKGEWLRMSISFVGLSKFCRCSLLPHPTPRAKKGGISMGCIWRAWITKCDRSDEIALARGLLEVRRGIWRCYLSRLPWARGNVKIKFRVIFYRGYYFFCSCVILFKINKFFVGCRDPSEHLRRF